MAGPLISFLTDLGAQSAPAVCRGVMWSIAPETARVGIAVNQDSAAARYGLAIDTPIRIEVLAA